MNARLCWAIALSVTAAVSGRAAAYSLFGQRWPTGPIVMHLQLGPSDRPLLDGSQSWGQVVEAALTSWNQYLGQVQFSAVRDSTSPNANGNRVNSVFFSDGVYGWSFGDAVAVATYWTVDGAIVESDVIFNREYSWDSYRGPLRLSSRGDWLMDIRRVALHEFGHTLGLDHPDEHGESVAAVMNSRMGDVDRLMADDIAGAQALYGVPLSCAFSVSPTSKVFSPAGGTGTISIATNIGCSWSAASNAPFIGIATGESGTGSGTVSYQVASNVDAPRSGTLTVAGVTVTVSQPAADTDGDGLPDAWETLYGLNPNSDAGTDGASGDPDGDGRTNLQEHQDRTHPRNDASLTRYFAEGATSSFFDTSIVVVNPGSAAATVLLRFLKSDGTVATQAISVPALARRSVNAKDVMGSMTAEFSTVIETDRQIIADRTMRWNATGYGSHTESAVAAPAATWYFAEGATHSGFSLFYLIQNPNAVAADVTITYLRPAPLAPIVRSSAVSANSRFTINVASQDARLTATDVSAIVQTAASTPIIVERAMYLDAGGALFGAGHDAAGVTATSTRWFFAEGATGRYFDLFILLANPGATDAAVTATYLLPNGQTIVTSHTVGANSRRTIWVDQEDARLADTAVSTVITSSVGIVAERTMWWPGTFATWHEAHNSPGATTTGTRWAVADGEVNAATGVAMYLLCANAGTAGGTVRVTLLMEDGTPNPTRDFFVGPESRFNIDVGAAFPQASGKRFGAIVESVTGAPLVVERSTYGNANGAVWASGASALATRLQ